MKKKISMMMSIMLLTTLLSVMLTTLTGCSGKLSGDIFKGYKVNLRGAVSIGISAGKSSRIGTTAKMSANTQSSLQESNKNKLVTVDAENIAREIIFEQIADADKKITQDDIKAEIDKVYVTDNFVYFRMSTQSESRNWADVYYDQRDYVCRKDQQSFVIDRATDKVYSLSGLFDRYGGIIDFIENNLIRVKSQPHTYYTLSIVGENAVFTDLVPNKNIYPGAVYTDKDGMIFIDNDSVNQVVGNIVYVTSVYGQEGFSYGLGSDGRFYRVEYSNFKIDEIHVFDSTAKEWASPTIADTLTINHRQYSYGNKHNNEIGLVYSHYTFIDGDNSYTESIFDPNYSVNLKQAVIGTCIFTLTNGVVKMRDFKNYNEDNWQQINVTIPNGVSINTFDGVMGDKIYATGHTATTTSRYQIYVTENGQPKCELVSFAEYNANIVVLQPLN